MLRQRPVYDEIQSIWASTLAWFDSHTTQIVIALILAAIIVALLMGIRWFGKKMARKPKEGSSWRAVIGGALAGMRFWFMAIVAAKVVSVYAIAPPEVAGPVSTLFIIAIVLQAALFARELILGAVELRAAEADPTGNLPSAIGLIRVLVSIALALMALILVLGNLGVNVSGLLAASRLDWLRKAFSPTCLPR
jgi:small-conductance mechanosensitive channel